jgi:hypothetical protein
MEAEQKGGKQKDFLVPRPEKKTARAGWPKRLRLVQVTHWANFAVITAQI